MIQVRLHLNVKLFNGIRMTGFVVRLFCIHYIESGRKWGHPDRNWAVLGCLGHLSS